MLARQVARAAAGATPRSSLRAFSSTATQCRAPTIADVTPNSVETFNTKQRQFREQLIAAQQQREERKLHVASNLSDLCLLFTPTHQFGLSILNLT